MLKSSDPVYQRDGTVTTLEDIADNAVLSPSTPFIDGATTETLQDFVDERIDLKSIVTSGAGAHNSIYRGVHLGNEVTAEQWEQIVAGTFDNLFIGDYWKINNINWRIAAFDYWLGTGDTECTDHHVVIVPDSVLYTAKMNDTAITTGGYAGSKMYTDNLDTAKTTINTAFGSSHILSHRELLSITVTNGKSSGWGWYDSTVELMSEVMVYGHNACGGNPIIETACDKTQLPIFAVRQDLIDIRNHWWLRGVTSDTNFTYVNITGYADSNSATGTLGVRPCFAIYQPITTNETKKSATKKRSVKK